MALTTCPDCGAEMSTSAAACPKCGRPIPKPLWVRALRILALTAIGMLVLVVVTQVRCGVR